MMAAIAARTRRLKFGPSVMMLPLRHPIAVAKDVATLDFSGGRCIMAVGLGADDKEADAFNVPRTQRAALTDESVAILRKLWAGPHVSHHGTFFHFDDVTITPCQKKIDLWIGGAARRPCGVWPASGMAGLLRLSRHRNLPPAWRKLLSTL